MTLLKDLPLSQYNSWKVGGNAEFYTCPETIDDVIKAQTYARDNGLALTILSGGTNVLVSDLGVRGLVIHLRKLTACQTEVRDGRLHITALAGASKSELLKIFLKSKLAPAEFLAGIPGDVGGGVVMNAGVGESIKPREFVEIVDWVEVLRDEKIVRLTASELKWSYRHCNGWQPGILVRVGMSWPDIPDINVVARVKAANQGRLKKQPLEWPSCGSVFVNPQGHKAGQLIDFCGLRGHRIGGAEVSEKHANFIINRDHATARDIDQMIRHVQGVVKDRTQVELKTEVVYLGNW